jgi:FkbM family methyltransferase
MGAADGLLHDPYREFIIQKNMRGMLVEPLPFQYAKLQRNYSHKRGVTFVQCAVSYPPQKMELFILREAFLATLPNREMLALQASTSRTRFIESLKQCGVPDAEEHVVSIQVPGCTVEQLMAQNNLAWCDCLFLDLEGYEPNVLLNMDYVRIKPKLIAYENIHLGERSEQIRNHLMGMHFKLFDFPQDTVAVAKEWLRC